MGKALQIRFVVDPLKCEFNFEQFTVDFNDGATRECATFVEDIESPLLKKAVSRFLFPPSAKDPQSVVDVALECSEGILGPSRYLLSNTLFDAFLSFGYDCPENGLVLGFNFGTFAGQSLGKNFNIVFGEGAGAGLDRRKVG
jgi:hypothetical protein